MENKIKNSDRQYYLFALKIMGDFGVAIAVPVVLLVLLGQWLDEKFGRSPLFVIVGFVLAILVSTRTIYKKAKLYGEEYRRMGEESNKK